MIRPATENDLRRIVEMSEKFYPYTSYNTLSKIPFNPIYVAGVASGLIDNGIMLVAEVEGAVVGMIGIALIPFIFNPDYLVAGEIIWWVEEEHRGSALGVQLIQEADKIRQQIGAVHFQMIDLPVSTLSAERVYNKLGFVLTERCFTKVT